MLSWSFYPSKDRLISLPFVISSTWQVNWVLKTDFSVLLENLLLHRTIWISSITLQYLFVLTKFHGASSEKTGDLKCRHCNCLPLNLHRRLVLLYDGYKCFHMCSRGWDSQVSTSGTATMFGHIFLLCLAKKIMLVTTL